MFDSLGKTLIIIGAGLLLLGIIVHFGAKWFPLGRLPGDIMIQKENGSFYFPITTCVLLSVIISLVLSFLNRR